MKARKRSLSAWRADPLGVMDPAERMRKFWAAETRTPAEHAIKDTAAQHVHHRSARTIKPRTSPTDRRCALYRHFDAEGILLYVGISFNPQKRGKAHVDRSVWIDFAVRMEADWLPSRDDAIEAELTVIRNEKPIFNQIGASGAYHSRVTEYLLRRKACS